MNKVMTEMIIQEDGKTKILFSLEADYIRCDLITNPRNAVGRGEECWDALWTAINEFKDVLNERAEDARIETENEVKRREAQDA